MTPMSRGLRGWGGRADAGMRFGIIGRGRLYPATGTGEEGDTRGLGGDQGCFFFFFPLHTRTHACPRRAYHTAASLSSGLGCDRAPL